MLRPRRAAPLLLLLALLAPAWAQDDLGGIRQPEQLTIGVADQFLGQLAPDGKELYFLSNRNTIREVYHQDLEAGQPTLLFDEGADVSWARLSPDGRLLLYISFRDDAVGQLCVRDLRKGQRRCLSDGARAVEAQWMGPREIALVSRPSLQGNLRLLRVTVDGRLTARPLLDRNLINPTVSPDGRWLVYVPVERYVERVGPGFAARAAQRLEAVRTDRPGSPPQPLQLDLPGQTGQPAFSVDGRSLYFTQFFNDSNHDGAIDASDNGVLFRVPFPGERADAPAAAASAFPEQLTDSAWNCQYPSPTAGQLITTCSRGGELDIHSLPLDGLVPGTWDADRLQLEIDLSSRPIEQQLLYRHLLRRQSDRTERRRTLMRLIYLHLEADGFDACEFYVRKLDTLGDPATLGLEPVLLAQVAHRRAVRAREGGRLGLGFADESRSRLAALDPAAPGSPSALALRRVVRSEISDALGDKDGAQKELAAAALAEVVMPAVLEAFYRRAEALYRQLDDAAALWTVARRLSEHPSLAADDRLRYARAAVRTLVRGLPLTEAQALLTKERAAATAGSELAFVLELTEAVLRIRSDKPAKAEREALTALYKQQSRLDRRRVVMLEAVQRATEFDAERVVEALVQLYIDDVPKGTRERRRAERLYQRFLEGRAYRRLASGRLDKARDDFAQVASTTGSFESHVGYIGLRLREGRTPAELTAEYDQRDADYSETVSRFVRAYLLSLKLPELDDEQHEKTARQVIMLLRGGGSALKGQPIVRALFGAVLFERFLRTGRLALAQRADAHYLVALELLRRNPRYKATVLSQLGLLHARVGNYHIALNYQKEREKIPFLDDAGGLLHYLVKARTLLHLSRAEDAAKAAETALAVCERTPALKEYRMLALDRAALYSLSAGRFARALELYDAELALLSSAAGLPGERNRLVVHLARAAAAVGAEKPRQALADLAIVDEGLSTARLAEPLRWPHTAVPEALRSYRLLAAGLRGKAHRSLGELDAAARALLTRRALAKDRLATADLDEHVQALALAEGQLAEVAAERRDLGAAGRWMQGALGHSERFLKRAGVTVNAEHLTLLWLAAELQLESGTDLHAAKLAERLHAAHEHLVKEQDPKLRSYARLLEIYLALIAPARGR